MDEKKREKFERMMEFIKSTPMFLPPPIHWGAKYQETKNYFVGSDSADGPEVPRVEWKSSYETSTYADPASVPSEEDILESMRYVLRYFNDFNNRDVTEFKRDENGTLYGYKVLVARAGHRWLWSPNWDQLSLLHSNPYIKTEWKNDELEAALPMPDDIDFTGIHGVKKLDDLDQWIEFYAKHTMDRLVVVKLALWGRVVETERGFRAQRARIVFPNREQLDEVLGKKILGMCPKYIIYDELHGDEQWILARL